MARTTTASKRNGSVNRASPEVHEAILKGASECFIRYGVRRTSMDDVAEAAGVSRATVYNYVSNKDLLVGELIVRENQRITKTFLKKIDRTLPSAELIAEAALFLIHAAVSGPFSEVFATPDQVRQTAQMLGHSEQFAAAQREYWAAIFEIISGRGELREDLDEADVLLWLNAMSFLFATGPTPFDNDRATHRRFLVQFVAGALLKEPREVQAPLKDPPPQPPAGYIRRLNPAAVKMGQSVATGRERRPGSKESLYP